MQITKALILNRAKCSKPSYAALIRPHKHATSIACASCLPCGRLQGLAPIELPVAHADRLTTVRGNTRIAVATLDGEVRGGLG